MKQNRFTEEQIVRALKSLKAGGITVAQQARKLGCAENTIYLWKKKYGGLEVNDLKELRELRQENSKLKQMVANLMLEKEAISEALSPDTRKIVVETLVVPVAGVNWAMP